MDRFLGMLPPSLPRLVARAAKRKSKLLYEIAAETTTSSQTCPLAQTHAVATGFARITIVGAGCSCHQTRRYQHLATRS